MRLIISATIALFSSLVAAHGDAGRDVIPVPPHKKHKTCTVLPLGNHTDDTPQILQAFSDCNHGGTVVFPKHQVYWIATRLNPVIYDVTIDWQGIWTLSDNLTYWRNHSYPVAFQNHAAGFVISGDRIHISGKGSGGIDGNGNAWYNAEKAVTQPGRPMPFVFWNTSEVFVEHCMFSHSHTPLPYMKGYPANQNSFGNKVFIKDSPLWALNIMNGTNMWFDDILANSTAVNVPYGTNWVQNTDGFDTMDANNIKLTNFWYQGGDDCIAIKPRSYNIWAQNITCHGGNGIAIGSLGQYLEDASVINVTVIDANISTYNLDMHNTAYIKTWIGELAPQSGYENAGLPRGGGWGTINNLLFENFHTTGAAIAAGISQDSGNNGSYTGTSKFAISDITFRNFTGTAANATGTCSMIAKGGVVGMLGSGCS
ncbi:glycoside hydrolase family 28 protein [Sclerotinia borealis F-4128]|uniref:galacturonan 1,4-alpha-galacturonidase n=1 Tax=Sclerotinia borealis (strain F-4128) TaxID=1432307 RepID=W9CT81_SCLBF|nr:glycoside hydrolase family 28 protein [Sclerotinia borealis F-4128]